MKQFDFDFVVVGSGLAGLLAAYHASAYGSVALISKSELDISNSYNAPVSYTHLTLPTIYSV